MPGSERSASPLNRRLTPRIPCRAPVVVEGPRGPIRGQCRDISTGGLFVVGAVLTVGRTFEVKVDLGAQGLVTAQGESRFSYNHPDGEGMGVKFNRISQEDLAKVQAWIERNAGFR